MNRRDFIRNVSASGLLMGIPRLAVAGEVAFQLRNRVGQKVLLDSLNDSNFWNGVEVERPSDQLYDEFKLKSMDQGYLTHVTGTGKVDFSHNQVADTVFYRQDKLPKHMSGAKAMPYISKGIDPKFNVEYTDLLFMGDMDFFYCEYYQRMYRYKLPDGRTICAFEKMDNFKVGDELWNKYLAIKKKTLETVSLRWYPLNEVITVTEAYGMYIIEPDAKQSTRVTLTAKLRFGSGTGILAQWGSEIPYLIRSGTLNGFNAHVDIVKEVKKGNYKL
jgi:hypothetical protein